MRFFLMFALLRSCNSFYDDNTYINKYNDGVDFYTGDDQYESFTFNDRRKTIEEFNVVGLEKGDREDMIRPCALDDRQCIREVFAANSDCKPSYGPIPEPLYFERNTEYLPFVNLSMVLTRDRITGLANAKISEFYINKDTGNLVIAIDTTDLNETSPKMYLRYKRTAKESIVLGDYLTAQYNSGTFTAIIPKVPHLRLDLAEIHVDLDNGYPEYSVGPGVYDSNDPDVLVAFAQLIADVPLALQEAFLFKAQLLMGIYIQKNICDFGLKIESI